MYFSCSQTILHSKQLRPMLDVAETVYFILKNNLAFDTYDEQVRFIYDVMGLYSGGSNKEKRTYESSYGFSEFMTAINTVVEISILKKFQS